MHLKIRSPKPQLEQLEALILGLESPRDIICISETWLHDNDNCAGYLISDYNQFCMENRQNAKVVGVMIQKRKHK